GDLLDEVLGEQQFDPRGRGPFGLVGRRGADKLGVREGGGTGQKCGGGNQRLGRGVDISHEISLGKTIEAGRDQNQARTPATKRVSPLRPPDVRTISAVLPNVW